MTIYRLVLMTALIVPFLTHCAPRGDHYLPGDDTLSGDIPLTQLPVTPLTHMEVTIHAQS